MKKIKSEEKLNRIECENLLVETGGAPHTTPKTEKYSTFNLSHRVYIINYCMVP